MTLSELPASSAARTSSTAALSTVPVPRIAARSCVGQDAAGAVGAEQDPVAGDDVDEEQVGLGLVLAVDGPQDQVAVRVDPRLLLGDPALVDQALHEGVVLGELADLAVAQQVAAAVADVADAERVPSKTAAVTVVLVPSSSGCCSTSSAIWSCDR